MVVDAAENTVHQGDKRQEGNQHSGDIKRQVQAVDGAAGDGPENVFIFGPFRFRDNGAGGDGPRNVFIPGPFRSFRLRDRVHSRNARRVSVRGCEWLLGFRHEHLRHQDSPGSGHDDGTEQVLGLHAIEDVGAHNAARDVRHACCHDRHQLGAGQGWQVRPNGERSFGLAHEDAGRYVQ